MLRSDAEIALDESAHAAAEAARVWEDAAQRSQEPARGRLLAGAASRNRIAAELAQAARSVGWLPRAPDPDAETVRAIAQDLHANLSADERLVLAEERAHADEEVAARLRELLALDGLPEPVRQAAERARAEFGSQSAEREPKQP